MHLSVRKPGQHSYSIDTDMVWYDDTGRAVEFIGHGEGTIYVEANSTFDVWTVKFFKDGTALEELAAE